MWRVNVHLFYLKTSIGSGGRYADTSKVVLGQKCYTQGDINKIASIQIRWVSLKMLDLKK